MASYKISRLLHRHTKQIRVQLKSTRKQVGVQKSRAGGLPTPSQLYVFRDRFEARNVPDPELTAFDTS